MNGHFSYTVPRYRYSHLLDPFPERCRTPRQSGKSYRIGNKTGFRFRVPDMNRYWHSNVRDTAGYQHTYIRVPYLPTVFRKVGSGLDLDSTVCVDPELGRQNYSQKS
jgi:hypothetical protein